VTGFYWLTERMLAKMAKRPPLLLPADLRSTTAAHTRARSR
jgi:hypothetical protein